MAAAHPNPARTDSNTTLPSHPLLQPLRSSRALLEADDDGTSPSSALTTYRTSLHELLDSERWAHYRTMQTLKGEIGRREQLERQLTYMRTEYQGLANSLARSAHNLMQCDAERIDLIRQVTSLRGELEN